MAEVLVPGKPIQQIGFKGDVQHVEAPGYFPSPKDRDRCCGARERTCDMDCLDPPIDDSKDVQIRRDPDPQIKIPNHYTSGVVHERRRTDGW